MLKMYAKTENMMDLLKVFTTRQWSFDNENTRKLWLSLSKEDRNMFWFSLEGFDWKAYIKIYYFGIRKHILHEDLSNTEKAISKNQK
jgi:alcohol-forming fatty acyl-CoA reductase